MCLCNFEYVLYGEIYDLKKCLTYWKPFFFFINERPLTIDTISTQVKLVLELTLLETLDCKVWKAIN